MTFDEALTERIRQASPAKKRPGEEDVRRRRLHDHGNILVGVWKEPRRQLGYPPLW